MHPLRRRLVALAALAASLCLVGCSVDATIVVTPDDMVSVDITTWAYYGVDLPSREQVAAEGFSLCDQMGLPSLTATPLSSDTGLGCHAEGRSALGELVWSGGGGLVHAGERYLAVTGEDFLGALSPVGGSGGATQSRLRLTLPGQVVATDPSASVSGNTITWTAPVELGQAGRLFALSTVAEPDWTVVLAGAGGLAAGVLAALTAIRLRRRSSTIRSCDTDDFEDEGDQ